MMPAKGQVERAHDVGTQRHKTYTFRPAVTVTRSPSVPKEPRIRAGCSRLRKPKARPMHAAAFAKPQRNYFFRENVLKLVIVLENL